MSVSQEGLKDKSEEFLSDPFENVIGSIGKWQMSIFLLIGLTRMTTTYNQMAHIFLAPTAAFRCKIADGINISHVDSNFDSVCVQNCTEYEYDRSVFANTVSMEFDLICEKSWFSDLTQTLFMIGMTIGGLLIGYIGDMFGRRNPFVICLILLLCLDIANAFSVNYIMYAILRFCIGFITNGVLVLGYVLLLECIGSRYRVLLSTLIHVPTTLGVVGLGLFGYFIRTWKMLQIAITIPSLVCIVFYIWMPESPRWLMSVGDTKKAKIVIENACKWNKRPTCEIDKAIDEMKSVLEKKTKTKAKFIDLFKPVLMKESICISVMWFVCGLNYFGTTFYLGQVGGSVFINLIASGCMQVLSIIASFYFITKFGRKKTMIGSYLGCGLFMIILTGTTSIEWLRVMLAIASSVFIAVAFNVSYLFTSEIFPTVVRNSAVGLGATTARIGSMIAPYVASLAAYSTFTPPILFGILSLIAAVACLPLPETAGKELKDTLEK